MNNLDDNAIFFISKGEVNIFHQQSTHLRTLKKGDSFGELSFFTEHHRSASAISNGFTKLFKLKREDFLCAL